MTDVSDDSDVRPEELARMVEDLDDLDNTLLGGSLKRKDPLSTIGKTDKDAAEVKKKVAFKDFNDDDPIADLLSDDDDTFEQKRAVSANTKSSIVADLFGMKNDKTMEKNVESTKPQNTNDLANIDGNKKKSNLEQDNSLHSLDKRPPIIAPIPPRPISQNVRDPPKEAEEMNGKAEEIPKLGSNKSKKSSLMEDLFGTRSRSALSTESVNPISNFSKLGLETPAPTTISESQKPSDQSAKGLIGYTMEPSTSREPRRGRRNSAAISDPLGLFSTPSSQTVEHVVSESNDDLFKNDAKGDLPEWLGGVTKSKNSQPESEKQTALFSGKSREGVPIATSSTVLQEPLTPAATTLLPPVNQERSVSYPDVSALMSSQFDQQAAIYSMQQQEHELRTAATLSHQNAQVNQIVENQKAKLNEQEKQFNVLIRHQIERQSMLETQMKIQQARIDHYIKALMSQPTSLPSGVFPHDKIIDEEIKVENNKSEDQENLVRKMQLENTCLENILDSLKQKHEREIQILEESYEKQILYLRQGIEKFQGKMHHDIEALEVEYERKIDKLKEEKDQLDQTYRGEIERLKKQELLLVEEIHDRHSRNVELLQKEHADTIDNISRAKELERLAIEAITSHKTDLGDLLEKSQHVIESFQSLQTKLEDKNEEFGEMRGSYLKKQEENLQLLKEQLSAQQEALSDERKRLLEVSQRLDAATAQLTSEFTKKCLIMNETEDRLATKERALIREKQLFDEQMKWEREHLQVTKDAWMKEQDRQIKLLSEERDSLGIEKAKLDVLNRLKSGSDDMAKVELEAALKTAQEAANAANQERQKWHERMRSLEAQKNALHEKEKHLMSRAKELEDLTQSALMKREEGFQALKEAQRIEQQYKERLGQLQIQLEGLAQRENKIAKEKLALARERLATRICNVENAEQDTVENGHEIEYPNERSYVSNSAVSTRFKDVVDPHLLLLKLNLNNKLDSSNELLAAMQVISQ